MAKRANIRRPMRVWVPRNSGAADELGVWGWVRVTVHDGQLFMAAGFLVEWVSMTGEGD